LVLLYKETYTSALEFGVKVKYYNFGVILMRLIYSRDYSNEKIKFI